MDIFLCIKEFIYIFQHFKNTDKNCPHGRKIAFYWYYADGGMSPYVKTFDRRRAILIPRMNLATFLGSRMVIRTF